MSIFYCATLVGLRVCKLAVLHVNDYISQRAWSLDTAKTSEWEWSFLADCKWTMELSKKKQIDELPVSSLHSDCLCLRICSYWSKLNGQKPQTCLSLFFGVDCSTRKRWSCSQLPRGEGIRTLYKIFNNFFSHSFGNFGPKKPQCNLYPAPEIPLFPHEDSLPAKTL